MTGLAIREPWLQGLDRRMNLSQARLDRARETTTLLAFRFSLFGVLGRC
jgi:hypothetical protein